MRALLGIAAALLFTASTAGAGTIPIIGDTANSTEGTGQFEGSLHYDNSSVLTIILTNTTTGGTNFITGFVFNVDGTATATLTPDPTGAFENLADANAAPFGTFDAGAALGGMFLGGGNPNAGIGVGETRTFQFNVTGPDASSLQTEDFLSKFSSSESEHAAAFLVRFRGGTLDSDKVPGVIIPLPAAAWTGLSGLLGIGLFGYARNFRRLLA